MHNYNCSKQHEIRRTMSNQNLINRGQACRMQKLMICCNSYASLHLSSELSSSCLHFKTQVRNSPLGSTVSLTFQMLSFRGQIRNQISFIQHIAMGSLLWVRHYTLGYKGWQQGPGFCSAHTTVLLERQMVIT